MVKNNKNIAINAFVN
jgi:hypothetical protein